MKMMGIFFVAAMILHLVRNGRGVLAMLSSVRAKAIVAARALGVPVLVEDSGLAVAGWGGFPGPLTKWITMGVLGQEGLAKMLDGFSDRAAEAVSVLAVARPGDREADVTVAEVHDCFSVMGAIGTEVIGKAEPGKGARYWVEGKASPDGECGINTSGGLIAKGHPIGATGIAMIGWSALQLLGKAPAELQVKAPKLAATFNIGGPICASVCTVLRPPR